MSGPGVLTMPKIGLAFNELDIIGSIVRESFYDFVLEFWDTIIAERLVGNWHIKYLCDELQKVAEWVFADQPKVYDLVINISPGSTKSTICSIMFPAWCWLRQQHLRFITASYAHTLALDLSRRSRDIVLCDKYKAISKVRLRQDQASKHFYMNTKGGFRIAVGTGGVTGFHGHFIIVDDPLNPNEALSEAEMRNANVWMTETLSNRKVDKGKTPTILIMQRLHQDDPTANMLERAGGEKIKHICIPAEETDNIKPDELRAFYQDGLMDPLRLSRDILLEARKSGEYMYAGQFLQHPIPLGGGMFKTDKIELHRQAPKKMMRVVRFWDKAGTHEGGAFTVGAKVGEDEKGTFWILDIKRGQWGSAEREDIIKGTAAQDGRGVIIGVEQEPGSGGKESAESTVRRLAGYRVKVDRPTGDKVYRADPFSVQVNYGNVKMLIGNWNAACLDELSYFPFSKYKDQTDALSGAFNILAQPRRRVGGLPRSKTIRQVRG